MNADTAITLTALVATPVIGGFCLRIAAESKSFAKTLPWLCGFLFFGSMFLLQKADLGNAQNAIEIVAFCSFFGMPLGAMQLNDHE